MAYELHIERIDPVSGAAIPIRLEEWLVAVAATDGLRPTSDPSTAQNPATGAIIAIPNAPGDVEINHPEEGWIHAFRWSRRGTAIFKASGDTSDVIHRKAIELARRLGAVVRGDEGEIYD